MTNLPTMVIAATLAVALRALAVEPVTPAAVPPGGDGLSLSQYYGDAVSHTGAFPGKIVCVPSEHLPSSQEAAHCEESKVFALSIKSSDQVVPLIAGSEPIEDRLKSLLQHEVIVRGKHYPDKGTIVVSLVERASDDAAGS